MDLPSGKNREVNFNRSTPRARVARKLQRAQPPTPTKVLEICYDQSSDAMGRLLEELGHDEENLAVIEELALYDCQNSDAHAYAAIDRKSIRTLRLHDRFTGARLSDPKDLGGLEELRKIDLKSWSWDYDHLATQEIIRLIKANPYLEALILEGVQDFSKADVRGAILRLPHLKKLLMRFVENDMFP